MISLPEITEYNFFSNFLEVISQDINCYNLFLKCISAKELLDQKLHDTVAEKERITKELEASERLLQKRVQQEKDASSSLREERHRKKLAFRENTEIKQNLDSVLDTLPMNMKKEILSRINIVYDSSSQSDIDITDSNLSSIIYSEAESPEEHFSKFYFKRSSSVMSQSKELQTEDIYKINGKNIAINRSNVNLHQPECHTDFKIIRESHHISHLIASASANMSLSVELLDEVSSSSDSERSSLLLFPFMFDRIMKRPHDLKSRHFVVGDRCNVCFLRIGCGKKGFTCFDCYANVHSLCHQELALPCIPVNTQKKEQVYIGDYCCPSFKPQIPALVIHCILQIEDRGLSQAGLYRESVYGRKLEEMKLICTKNRGVPNLNNVKIGIICVVLKDFLASLKLALIPQIVFNNMLEYFISNSGSYGFEDIYNMFIKLPIPNRDTLVFIILHLQKVAESPDCKMSAKSLSKVFSPLLIENYEIGTYERQKTNCSLIEKFIKLPSHYWKRILLNDL